MNTYIGKICPFCKTEFKAGDDIVVCSECDMPHHKECWIENQGCTTFGCLGTIKAADNVATSVTTSQMTYEGAEAPATGSFVFCTQCGVRNTGDACFCSRCGNRLTVVPERGAQLATNAQTNASNNNPYSYANQQNNYYQSQNNYQQNNYQQNNYQTGYGTYSAYQTTGVDPDMQMLIGKKIEYYVPKFQIMKIQGKQTTWNWPAFLVTPYWMIYRKMYGYGAAVLAVDVIISLIGSAFLSLLALGGYIVFGIFGNSIYMKHLENKAGQAKVMSEPFKTQFLAANGGVNTTATVLTIIGRVLLVSVLLA